MINTDGLDADTLGSIDPELVDENRLPCDEYCPYEGAGQACGIPDPWEIREMIKSQKVWMCHSFRQIPCCCTNLKKVPDGWQPITEKEYNSSDFKSQ